MAAAACATRPSGGVDEQELIAVLPWEQAREARIRHQQLALKDAVGERRDEPQPDRPIPSCDDDIVAKLLVEHVGHRIRVGDDGNDLGIAARVDRPVQQQPGVGAFGVGGGQGTLEREASGFDERAADAEDARILRLVQVQTARIVSWKHPKWLDRQPIASGQPERLAAVARVGIVRRSAAASRRATGSRRHQSDDRWRRNRHGGRRRRRSR